MLSYRRETALQGGLVMAKSGRLELVDNICGHYRKLHRVSEKNIHSYYWL